MALVQSQATMAILQLQHMKVGTIVHLRKLFEDHFLAIAFKSLDYNVHYLALCG